MKARQLSLFTDRDVRRSEISFAYPNPSKALIREYHYKMMGNRYWWDGQDFVLSKCAPWSQPDLR